MFPDKTVPSEFNILLTTTALPVYAHALHLCVCACYMHACMSVYLCKAGGNCKERDRKSFCLPKPGFSILPHEIKTLKHNVFDVPFSHHTHTIKYSPYMCEYEKKRLKEGG